MQVSQAPCVDGCSDQASNRGTSQVAFEKCLQEQTSLRPKDIMKSFQCICPVHVRDKHITHMAHSSCLKLEGLVEHLKRNRFWRYETT